MKIKIYKKRVLVNVGDLFNELYYIYKDKYSEEKHGLNTKDEKVFTTKNWDLLMIISTSLKKKNNKSILVKNLIKKNYLKNQQKMIW